MSLQRDRLVELIEYVEATERDYLKTVTDALEHKSFFCDEYTLGGLPGVTTNYQGPEDCIWLRVERLAKQPAPRSDDVELGCWLVLKDDPQAAPTLAHEIKGRSLVDAEVIPAGDAPDTIRLEDYEHNERVRTAFTMYVEGPWAAWADREAPRRRTITLYNSIFALRQLLHGAAETPLELVCGIGFAVLRRSGQTLRYPLITVQMEIALDDASHVLELRPRSEVAPRIEAEVLDKLELSSVDEFRIAAEGAIAGLEDEPLSPFERSTFELILKRGTAVLDADAHYIVESRDPADRSIPKPNDVLQISDVYAFFQRERRATQLMDDLRRFKEAIHQGDEEMSFPEAVAAIVTEPATSLVDEELPAFRGLSTIPGVTASHGSSRDLFFPKPFNREQVEVAQKLAVRPGVVVQGPPGTGKTHTIANVICHYLALGKRVLVTSQKADALKVLRAELPGSVRPLAVSLLDSDRDGLKQFRESVDIIAERIQRTSSHEYGREIRAYDDRIDGLHRRLAAIDREIDEIGRNSTAPIEMDGERVEPADAAKDVVAHRELAEWVPDKLGVGVEFEPRFADDDISAVRAARKALGSDLSYLGLRIPDLDEAPDEKAILPMHRDLARAEDLRRQITAGQIVELARETDDALVRLEKLQSSLNELNALQSKLAEAGFGWTGDALATIRRQPHDEALSAIEGMSSQVVEVGAEDRHFISRPIVLPEGAQGDTKLIEAIERLASGASGLNLIASIFSGQLKARLGVIRVVGEAPKGSAEWQEVRRFLSATASAERLKLSWNHVVGQSCLDQISASGLVAARAAQRQLDHLSSLRECAALEERIDREAVALLSGWARSVKGNADTARVLLVSVEAHLLRSRLQNAEIGKRYLIDKFSAYDGVVTEKLQRLARFDLGNPDIADEIFVRDWGAARRDLAELHDKRGAFEVVSRVASAVEASGAAEWAERLRRDPVSGVEDAWAPGDWRERWRLRRLSSWLSGIDKHHRLRALSSERLGIENDLKHAYEHSIELRTWLELRNKATDSVRSALASYAEAVRRIGRGTGKQAASYRREARDASERAKGALPCWIMPHYRVSESLPSELGLFDLVIVDEASQSTVAALPALLRAKQVLIVGDDRQVSPELVGRDHLRADELAHRHLSNQVEHFRSALREEKSLYDLGKVVFAGGAIMLTEHFRSVPPIIEFSKAEFYSHRLLPLRIPKASERLDPPLVDILVVDGYRNGKTNPPEADCIISEIERTIEDPLMARRTIGVTTLLGQEQAALIYSKIEDRIGTEAIERHRIRVGDPTAFQGDQRNIMFISLVAQAGDAPLAGTLYEQRFNVAASRARDRMVLVRSVELDDLRPADKLRRALLEHFRAPFAAEERTIASRRERCESQFERDVFDALAERGFRLDTQVKVGNFRIDIVVEGEGDRRLAIECDGDRFHGPDKWSADMARQRVLERAGWEVWRCFASRFYREREAVLQELLGHLNERGIGPTSSEGFVSRHTEQRRWCSKQDGDTEASDRSAPDISLANALDVGAVETTPPAEPTPCTTMPKRFGVKTVQS